MTLFEQIFLTLSFVFGIFAGEILASKIFGIPKKFIVQILEIVFFIIIAITIFNFLLLEEFNIYVTAAVYFIIAFLVIFFLRGITTLLGRISLRIQKRKEKKREDNIVDFTRSLARRGYTKEEIKNMLVESGFNRKKIERILETGLIETQAKIKKIIKKKPKPVRRKLVKRKRRKKKPRRKKPKVNKPLKKVRASTKKWRKKAISYQKQLTKAKKTIKRLGRS